MASEELKAAATDLCRWAAEEGIAMFILWAEDDGSVTSACLALPAESVCGLLRAAAKGYEAQGPRPTLQ